MIPLKLSLEGFYSYRKKQEICFESLTQQGLFGIFGSVGSGKSSILEAIMFALFDDSERLNKSGDDRYYNMLNLQSDAFKIDFTFKAGSGNQEIYRMVCSARRNSKRFEDVKGYERYLYHWQDNDWRPLDGQRDAASLLGMDYKHFRQTVIIPQGKFRDFIDQTSGDRTKMLKELFQLQQFDLGPQTGSLLKKTEVEIAGLKGQLESLGDASEEALQAISAEIQQLLKTEKELEEKCKALRKQEEAFRQMQTLFQELENTQNQLRELEEQADVYAKQAERLKLYSKAYTHFHQLFKEQEESLKELKKKYQTYESAQAKLRSTEASLKELEESYEAAKTAYDGRDKIRQACEELERVCRIKEKENAHQQASKALQELEQQLLSLQEQNLQTKQNIKQLESQLAELEETQTNLQVLAEVKAWLLERERLQQQLELHSTQQEKLKDEQERLLQARNRSLNGFGGTETDWEKLQQTLKKQARQLEEEEHKVLQHMQHLKVQAQLAAYAESLQEGEPCPLCGAEHHPSPSHAGPTAEALKKEEAALLQLKEKARHLTEALTSLVKLQTEQQHLQNRMTELQTMAREQQQLLAQHLEGFSWPDYAGYDLPRLQKEQEIADRKQRERREKQTAYKAKQDELDRLSARLDQLRLKKEMAQRTFDQLDIEIRNWREGLSVQNQRWLQEKGLAELQESLKRGKARYEAIELDYSKARQMREQGQEAWLSSKAQLKALEEQLEELQQKTEKRDVQIDHLCIEKGFTDREHVKRTLAFFNDKDPDAEQKKIDDYYTTLNQTKGQLSQLTKKAEGKFYREAEHEALQLSLHTQEEALKETTDSRAQASQRKADMEVRLAQQGELHKQLDRLTERYENLKTLAGLFRGNGFVDYVSGIRLQDLCRTANERFFRLTRNNLSLELDERHNFIVRDYLNEGRTRLLKTLSGGQSFQAALCLALAMAEHVKSLNRAEQSFFFLDEGFGALDKENLRVVFETLKSLRQENRIVGIISHVEELQQEIDLYLQVENTPEHGSRVRCSWE